MHYRNFLELLSTVWCAWTWTPATIWKHGDSTPCPHGTSTGRCDRSWCSSKKKTSSSAAWVPIAKLFTSSSEDTSSCQCDPRIRISPWTTKCSTSLPADGSKPNYAITNFVVVIRFTWRAMKIHRAAPYPFLFILLKLSYMLLLLYQFCTSAINRYLS